MKRDYCRVDWWFWISSTLGALVIGLSGLGMAAGLVWMVWTGCGE